MEICGQKNVETLKVLYACFHVNVTVKTNLAEHKPNEGMSWYTFYVFLYKYHVELKDIYSWVIL